MIETNKDLVKILAIDGGGVRGIIPVLFLKYLREQLNNTGNATPFYQLFDLIAGTSTGSLISLMLVKPPKDYSDEERLSLLMDLYQNKTKEIFPPAKCEMFSLIHQLLRPKYNGKSLKRLLRKYMLNYTLNDALSNLLVPAFDLHHMEPYFFKHRPFYKDNKDDLNFYLRDVGLSSASAPTYLPPAHVKSIPSYNKSYCFVDGGVFCNNPSLSAYIEARKLYPNANKYLVVSLGTGDYTLSYSCKKAQKWGAVGWINPFNHTPMISCFMYSQEESVNHMIQNIPQVKVYRFDVNLDGVASEMDDSSDKNIAFLNKKADEMIENSRDTIQRLVKVLDYYSGASKLRRIV